MSQEMNARRRTTLKSTHILGLEAKFMEDSRPSNQVRAELAKSLNLNERTVQIWFQNRRTKARASGAMPKACFRKPKSATTTTTTDNKESNESESSPLSAPSDSNVPYSLNFNIQHQTNNTTSQDHDLPHPPTKSHSYPSLPLPHYSHYPTSHYTMDPHELQMDLLPLHDPYLTLEPNSATTNQSYPMDLMYNFDLNQHHQSLPMDLMFHHQQSPSLFAHPYPHLH